MFGKKLNKNNVVILVGPTSSGKTALALELCKKVGGQMISADSRQVYSYADIGTGKVPINSLIKINKHENYWELDGIKVWGYDLVSPAKGFSVIDYYNFAIGKIRELRALDVPTVVVGGTGFYVDTLCGNVRIDAGVSDPEIRKSLSKLTLEALLIQLGKIDPKTYESIDRQNRQRVQRAVEKVLVPSSQKPSLKNQSKPEFVYRLFGLRSERGMLYEKVDRWVEAVWQNGLVEETRFLSKNYEGARILNGIVYKTVVQFFLRELDEKQTIQRIKWDLHAYIRRQLTWFNRNTSIDWINSSPDAPQECIMKIQKVLTHG